MKTSIRFLLTVSFLFSFYSCGHKPYPRAMQIADSIVVQYPDSAVSLLKQLKKNIIREPKSTQMYYYLLYTKAKDKAYIPHTSDSLMLTVLHYYQSKKDKKHLPEAYYYTGCIYRDLGDAPQALDYFGQAIEASKGSTDYKVISLIYSQIGTLYLYQDIYDLAMKAFKKAYYYNKLAKESIRIVYNLRDIGRTFTGFNNADSALYYYRNAYKQAVRVKDKHLMDVTQYGLAGLYVQLHDYKRAKQMLQSTSKKIERGYISGVYSISADLYYKLGNTDSASYFFNQLLNVGTIYAKQAAHWGLAQIAEEQFDSQTAIKQLREYSAYSDSIQKITATETIEKMHSLYNYQLREKENNKLRRENTSQALWIGCILFALALLSAFIISYIQYNKRKKSQWQTQLNKLEHIKEEQYKKSVQFIEENNKQIRRLEEALQQAKRESNTLKENLLNAQKDAIEQTNTQIVAKNKEEELAVISLKQSDIYILFHNAANEPALKITDDNWDVLQNAIDNTYNSFTQRLHALYPVSEIEKRICLLIKISIPIKDIPYLVSRSKQAVTSARKRLYEKIHGESCSPETFDSFIYEF
ncbi:tetratricopeptide repeat protein [uncultured Bacteroides sp.]|uniref:tetratricopeptide repeat protein n=1 Tax=uncultured Bacteroides sp. TaxID=162156 RepID=UPI002AA8FFD9|nr:tetratricopeptide repeat protein [uncultured Bacteroides sp.]